MRYRYREDSELKDSGIEWLGKIPKDWRILNYKRIINILNGNGFPEHLQGIKKGDVPFYKVSDINFKGDYIFESNNYVNIEQIKNNNWNIIKSNSILLPKIGEALKKNHRKISTERCLIDNNMCALESKGDNIKYLLYLFKIVDMSWYLNPGAVPSININKLKDDRCALPKINEQKKIANFLDKKTSEFDLIISKKEKLIERLEEAKKSLISEVVTGKIKVVKTDNVYKLVKRSSEEMKDSGVDWLGSIPKDWEISRLKYINDKEKYSFVDGPFGSDLKSEEYKEEGVPLIQLNNIKNGQHILNNLNFICEEKSIQLDKHSIYPGDLVIAKMAHPVARTAIVSNEYRKYTIVADCIRLKLNNNICDTNYINFAMNSNYFKSQAENVSTGTTRLRINLTTLKQLYIALPTLKEQKYISGFLIEKTKRIDDIISRTNVQIEKLKEAKQSLISEAVTGKIEILD